MTAGSDHTGRAAAIQRALKESGQYTERIPASDEDAIKELRSLGRRVARDLGWKVRTLVTDGEHRSDGMSVVWIVVIESSPLHQQLMEVRGQNAIRRAFRSGFMEGGY